MPTKKPKEGRLAEMIADRVTSSVLKALNSGHAVRDPRRKLERYPANMTVDQVADYLNCDPKHVTNLYEEGVLAGKDIASGDSTKRCLRFTREAVAAFEEQAKNKEGL